MSVSRLMLYHLCCDPIKWRTYDSIDLCLEEIYYPYILEMAPIVIWLSDSLIKSAKFANFPIKNNTHKIISANSNDQYLKIWYEILDSIKGNNWNDVKILSWYHIFFSGLWPELEALNNPNYSAHYFNDVWPRISQRHPYQREKDMPERKGQKLYIQRYQTLKSKIYL